MAETQEQERDQDQREQGTEQKRESQDEGRAEQQGQESGEERSEEEREDSEQPEGSGEGEGKGEDSGEGKGEESDEDESSGRGEDSDKAHMIAHLKDTHALEIQSIRQLERAVKLTEDSDYQEGYEKHLEQSHEHEEKLQERLKDHDLKPSAVKDLTMRAGALGTRQLADIAPDTPVKLAMHFYALEHLEIAAYEVLGHVAKAAGDNDTAEAAEEILEQEREMAEHIQESFEGVAKEMLEREPPEDPEDLPAVRGSGEDEEEEEEEEDSDEEQSSDDEQGSSDEEGPSGKAEDSDEESKSGDDSTKEDESDKEEDSDE